MTTTSPAISKTGHRPVRVPLTRADTCIAQHQPFTSGALRGELVRWMPSPTGRLSSVHALALGDAIHDNRNRNRATFVVWSYATPIAWTDPDDQLVVPDVRYSQTTTRHQNLCRRVS